MNWLSQQCMILHSFLCSQFSFVLKRYIFTLRAALFNRAQYIIKSTATKIGLLFYCVNLFWCTTGCRINHVWFTLSSARADWKPSPNEGTSLLLPTAVCSGPGWECVYCAMLSLFILQGPLYSGRPYHFIVAYQNVRRAYLCPSFSLFERTFVREESVHTD